MARRFVIEVEDALVSWFLRNIVVPKIYDFENPGFVIERINDGRREAYRRQFFFPEEVLAAIETQFVKKYGERARQALYAAGKKFGYSYSSYLHFPNVKTSSTKELEDFSRLLVQYVAVQCATRAEQAACDVKTKEFRVRFWEYAVCRKNGIGYLIGSGGIAGIWAYMMQDMGLEGVHPKCQGRGDAFCEFYVAPEKKLQERKMRVMNSGCNVNGMENEEDYFAINKVRQTNYAQHSMKELIDAGFFNYEDRKMSFHGKPHFSLEITAFYLLEAELANLNGGRKLLFDICFDFGRGISPIDSGTGRFATDYLSALGFGDVALKNEDGKITLIADNFPWTHFSEKSDFTMFRGLASGIASGSLGRKVVFAKSKTSLITNEFSISLTETK